MLKGSTSALRYLPALSSQLPCRLLRSSARFITACPPRSRFSTSHYPQSALKEQTGSGNHVASVTSGALDLCTRFLSSRHRPAPAKRAPFVMHPSVFRGTQALSIAKGSSVDHVARVSPFSDKERVLRWQKNPHILKRTKRKCPAQRRRTLLWIMLTTKSPERSWAAYQTLLSYGVAIPRHLLHQLARLLATIKPRTRTVHLQFLSVLKTLQRNHGRMRLWEWNTLIDSSGKHWHKTRLEDYQNALDIFNKKGALSAGNAVTADEVLSTEAHSCVTQQEPDIWTYNILLSIASRSNSPLALRHASSLFLSSGLPPNRNTHLCLLRYFGFRKDLRNVCSTLEKMNRQGLEIGLDGINACLWAYARNKRFDVAWPIYRLLRSNVKPIPDLGEHDLEEDVCYVRNTVGLDIPNGLEPDQVTYTVMIQTLSYHGDLRNALSAFVDMLSTPNREVGVHARATTTKLPRYKPSMAAFRGLFLGFSRHGQGPECHTVEAVPVAKLFGISQASWDLETLETVFAAFLQLPSFPKPSGRVFYWILVAFGKTSGNDAAKLREVWTTLESKYGADWGGRLEEIRRSIFTLDDRKV